MADIVLINPRFEPSYWGLEYALGLLDVSANVPVSALPLLAALAPEGHSYTIIDENVEAIDFDRCARADIVGVTGMIVQRYRMREIVEALKQRGCFVAIGGPWVTVQEDYFAGLADVIFVGEAETTWPRFLSEWGRGQHATRYEQSEKTDMSTVPVPRHELLKMDRYAIGSVQFSRGCPFTCEFCDIIVTFGRRPRIKTSAQILAEVEALWKRHHMDWAFIVDDNLIGNKKEIKVLLKALGDWQRRNDYPMTFLTEASIDLADSPEMMDLMAAANIKIVFVGVETPNAEALRETGKLQNLRAGGTSVEKIQRIQDAGMEVWSGHIVGFDSDGPDIFERQVEFIEQARIVNAMVGMLSAIPKTPLHARLLKAGRLDPSDRPATGTNVIPEQLSREDLRDGYIRVMRALNAPEAYFARLDRLYARPAMRRASRTPRRTWRHRVGRDLGLLAEAAFIVLRLQTRGPDRTLRRAYRRVMGRALLKGGSPQMLQTFALKCAMHYHAHRLVADLTAGGRTVNSF